MRQKTNCNNYKSLLFRKSSINNLSLSQTSFTGLQCMHLFKSLIATKTTYIFSDSLKASLVKNEYIDEK